MDNKKALSDIVATVLIILLTVAAGAVLVNFIKPFVEKNLNKSTECLSYKDYISFESKIENGSGQQNYNCWQSEGNNYLIGSTIKAGNDITDEQLSKIKGFLIVFTDGSNTASVNLANGITPVHSSGGVWDIENNATALKINNPRDISTYVYNSTSRYSKAELHIVLDSRTCEKFDTIEIKECNGVKLNG